MIGLIRLHKRGLPKGSSLLLFKHINALIMIQEKDFLYRVPVKNALVTTPNQQVRNPEILVDVEGGEFMHGNILDANSTNKLINQSVKDAVDNKLIESGYVTQDLLDAETTRATEQENSLKTLIGAETSARTKGDESLSAKIKAEQTRAEGKEKEISDKLAIVDGDSNTEGSFRKAIADVIAAAPEDLDTLKEIADKLAGNDDLHTALNQAITEKADASALLNEVTRATGAESGLQAAIATKADATALMALEKKVTANTTALEGKQDKGNYVAYDNDDGSKYTLQKGFEFGDKTDNVAIDVSGVDINIDGSSITLNGRGIMGIEGINNYSIDCNSISLSNQDDEITISPIGISSIDNGKGTDLFNISSTAIILGHIDNSNVKISSEGIKFAGKTDDDIPTANGTFKPISDFVLKEDAEKEYATQDQIDDIKVGLAKKQDKIKVNSVDVTNLTHANIDQLINIVQELLIALNSSGLIIMEDGLE